MPAFTDCEYSTMWHAFVIVGVMGLYLNVFMMLTWIIGKQLKYTDFHLKGCVFCGVFYGSVDTLPVLILTV